MQRTARRFRIAAAAVAVLVTATIGLLAWHLRSSQQSEQALLLQQAEYRAGQLAASAAGRIGAILRSVDFVLLEVRSYYGVNEPAFRALADRVRASFPESPELLLQFSVAAADGELVYSSLGRADGVNVADRDAFRAHLDGRDRLHVSDPAIGRLSGVESIHFTRPVLRGGRFAGTAAIALSPQRLGAVLGSFDAASDAEFALLGSGGSVLTLSSDVRRPAFLGKQLPGFDSPASRAVAARGALRAGVFGDGAEHVVAWQGVADTGLAVVVALDWGATLAPHLRLWRRTRSDASVAAAVLVLLGAGVIALLLRMSRQQQAVAASESRLRSLADRLQIGQTTARMIVMDWLIAEDRLEWSDSPEWLRGPLPAQSGRYPLWKDQIHPDDRERFLAARARSIASLRGQAQEYRFVRTDGEVLWLRSHQQVLAGPGGKAERMIVALLDVTGQKVAEEQLRLSEATLAGVINTAMDAIITIDERQCIVSFNPSAERIFGYRAAEMSGRPVAVLLPERLRDRHREHVGRFGELGETRRSMGVPGEIVGLRSDGGEIRLEATIARVEAGGRLRFSVMLRDVTERRRTEQRVREQARLLDLIFRHSIDSIVLLDRDFNFLRVSDSYARACQRDIAEFEGRNHFELFPSDFREEAEQARASKAIYHRIERPFVFPDHPEWGVTHWDVGLVPILGPDGEVDFFLLTLKDVSERVRAAVALHKSASRLRRLSSRLREVEERERRAMARELHDRIGQNLSALDLALGMLGQQVAAARLDGANEHLAEMQRTLKATIGHARDLMCELRPPALEEYGLLAALRDLVADFRRKTRIAATVEGDLLQPRPPETIELSMYRIAQEALNNAAKHAGATEVRLGLRAGAGTIELAISDDGIGFDAAQAGNGAPTWGLATMRERAEEAGIELSIDSAPGRGTRITLRAHCEA
ncbi:MAG: PAS domain S-box protein [Betaproteobacteria bacterium]|nr:MAG: PAS domain S-box protein [Betaproteobacteria bacterium]